MVWYKIIHLNKGIDFGCLNVFSGCKASISSVNGTISSPAFGLSDYPSNQECLFSIKKPGGGALSLKFEDFDVHQSDFVQVRYEIERCSVWYKAV